MLAVTPSTGVLWFSWHSAHLGHLFCGRKALVPLQVATHPPLSWMELLHEVGSGQHFKRAKVEALDIAPRSFQWSNKSGASSRSTDGNEALTSDGRNSKVMVQRALDLGWKEFSQPSVQAESQNPSLALKTWPFIPLCHDWFPWSIFDI